MKLLGRLVLNGRLKKEDVLKCIKGVEGLAAKGKTMSLSEAAVRLKLLSEEQLDLYRRSGGDDVPNLPGFVIKEKLGEGGTSNVYRYLDTRSEVHRAVKVLKEDQVELDNVRQSFVREAKLLIGLDHPNIVKGFKVGTVKGRYVFIMELIDGDDLQDLLSKGMTFGEDAALYIVLQAAKALEHMGQRGILHRDIKPGNIMLKRDNSVKLIDLGFATSVGAQDDETAPEDSTLGTVQYISPEQARGQHDLDVRSDIYSLGATLYQLAVGELPFTGSDDQEILARQILDSLSSSALKDRARISPHMHYFIEKMMAKEREIRYQDPSELIQDIEEKIRGKKTLTYRPDMPDQAEGEDFIDTPYDSEGSLTTDDSSEPEEAGPPINAPIRVSKRRFRR